MTVKDIMARVKAAKKGANARDVAMRLLSEEYTSLPVVDDEGFVIGIVSEFDILKALKKGGSLEEATIDGIMSKNPLCVEEDMTVDKLTDVMTKKRLLRVPVVRDGVLVGTVSRKNILDFHLTPEFKESFWVLRG